MKRDLLIAPILVIMIILTHSTEVLGQHGSQMQKFKEERMNFFNEKLQLSEAEAKNFWPLQEDFHNRNMKINEEEKVLLNYYSSNYEALTDEEVEETIGKYQALQKKRVELGKEFHDKFVSAIGERKTMRMYALDREFRIYILKKFRARGGGGGPQGRDRAPSLNGN